MESQDCLVVLNPTTAPSTSQIMPLIGAWLSETRS
jgi:hypothetical protein